MEEKLFDIKKDIEKIEIKLKGKINKLITDYRNLQDYENLQEMNREYFKALLIKHLDELNIIFKELTEKYEQLI